MQTDTSESRVVLNGFSLRIVLPCGNPCGNPSGSKMHDGFTNNESAMWHEKLVQWGEVIRRGGHRYIEVPHNEEYAIHLSNNRSTKCDAAVRVDGRDIGTFRVASHGSLTIRRPAGEDRKLIFVREGSAEGRGAGVTPGVHENGLIEVTFTPEKRNACFHTIIDHLVYADDQCLEACDDDDSRRVMCRGPSRKFDSGATVLGGATGQSFFKTADITNIDSDNVTTIRVRLVAPLNKKPVAIRNAPGDLASPNYTPPSKMQKPFPQPMMLGGADAPPFVYGDF